MPWLSVSADGQGLCSKKKAVILKAWNKKDQTIMKCQRQKNEQRGYRMIYCVEDERNIRELLVYTLETPENRLLHSRRHHRRSCGLPLLLGVHPGK